MQIASQQQKKNKTSYDFYAALLKPRQPTDILAKYQWYAWSNSVYIQAKYHKVSTMIEQEIVVTSLSKSLLKVLAFLKSLDNI